MTEIRYKKVLFSDKGFLFCNCLFVYIFKLNERVDIDNTIHIKSQPWDEGQFLHTVYFIDDCSPVVLIGALTEAVSV